MAEPLHGPDPALLRLALTTRAPKTKEELFWFCKEVVQIPCAPCGGSGKITIPSPGACRACGGIGKRGFHFGRHAICADHHAPLDVLAELWFGKLRHVLLIANREAGKTQMLALLSLLWMHFGRYSIAHMGSVEAQAFRARDYLQALLNLDPWKKNIHGQLSQTQASLKNGAHIEWLTGTLAQASGVHPELSILDECDQAEPAVRQRFLKTPTGPRSCFIEASTHYIQMGTISQILRESPNLPVRRMCLWESLAHCEYDCEQMPQLDGSLGRCALYESVEHTADGRMQVVPLCGGTIARRCDGHIDVIHAQLQWAKSDPWSRRVEYLCEPPDRPIGGRAYWNFHATDNRLTFNPDIQPMKPLEWTMDFGPGVGARMCSTILQTSPDGTEDWVVDEIVLGTSSTLEVVKEFLRRYGPDGCIAPQHSGGIWIYGDRSGHTRASTTGDTDYDIIISMLRNTPGFRLMVLSGDANPPLIDRLNLVNRLLCDERGRRRLKVAPRCKQTIGELDLMPLGADRKKDKSDKVQRVLGLSHIGDGIEYWAWKKYGRAGVVMGEENRSAPPIVAVGAVRRESAILVSRSGRRLSSEP